MGYYHQRNLVHLHQSAQRIRQIGGGANGGIPCLGVHTQNVAILDHAADRFDQMNIIGELAGADRTDPGQQPGHHVIAVDIDHIIDLSGVCHHGGQLKVNERLVIAEDDIRRLQPLHVDGFQGVLLTN